MLATSDGAFDRPSDVDGLADTTALTRDGALEDALLGSVGTYSPGKDDGFGSAVGPDRGCIHGALLGSVGTYSLGKDDGVDSADGAAVDSRVMLATSDGACD